MYTTSGIIDKEQFVVEFAPLVKRIAHHMMMKLPASVEVDDLIQAGMIGLLDAINRYEGAYGRQFESYAAQRIRDQYWMNYVNQIGYRVVCEKKCDKSK